MPLGISLADHVAFQQRHAQIRQSVADFRPQAALVAAVPAVHQHPVQKLFSARLGRVLAQMTQQHAHLPDQGKAVHFRIMARVGDEDFRAVRGGYAAAHALRRRLAITLV